MKRIINTKRIGLCLLCLTLITGILTACDNVPDYVASSAIVEAGNYFGADAFIVSGTHTAEFDDEFAGKYVTNGSAMVPHTGEVTVGLIVDGKHYDVKLSVQDHTAPQAKANNLRVCEGAVLKPEDCVYDVVDASEVTYAFKSNPDTSKAGSCSASVVITDAAGNTAEVPVVIEVVTTADALAKDYTIEAGSNIPDANKLIAYGKTGKYVTDVSVINTNLVGVFEVVIEIEGNEYTTSLQIVDTIAPTADINSQTAYVGGTFPKAESFVSNIVDAGPVSVSYEVDPDEVVSTETTVRIVLKDQAGNKTVYEAICKVAKDEDFPVFVMAPDKIEVDTGNKIIWRALVNATDATSNVEVTLDSSKVNLDKPGEYTAYFIATDQGGNATKQAVKIVVHDSSVTEEMLTTLCDKIIANIIDPDMTNVQKVQAVFKYIRGNLSYVDAGASDDMRREAYLGLTTRKNGDCFTYASVSVALLNRAGFETIVVCRSPEGVALAKSGHKWVLVNIGTASEPKWYHFDATPMLSRSGRFITMDAYLMTDAQVDAYTKYREEISSGAMKGYFMFDKTLYPERATEMLTPAKLDPKYYD